MDGRRGEAISSLVSGGCIISGAPLRRTLLFTGVHVHSYAQVENALILPDADIGRHARLRNVIVEKGVRIPPGLVVGEDPDDDARRFRRTEKGVCLITQPMIDGLAWVTALTVLGVVSEIFPLIKTGGLADVAGALPPALEAEGVHTITLVPGYPAVLRGLIDAGAGAPIRGPVRRPSDVCCAEVRRGWSCWRSTPPTSMPGPAAPISPRTAATGRTIRSDSPRCRRWRRTSHRGRWPASSPTCCMRTIGRPAWRRPICTTAAGGAHATVMTVHNLAFQGRFWSGLLSALHLPPEAFSIDGVECYGDIGFLKAGLFFADRITTVSPTYAAEIQHARRGHGAGWPAALPRLRCSAAS